MARTPKVVFTSDLTGKEIEETDASLVSLRIEFPNDKARSRDVYALDALSSEKFPGTLAELADRVKPQKKKGRAPGSTGRKPGRPKKTS